MIGLLGLVTAAYAADDAWRLAAVYDATAVGCAPEQPAGFTWSPHEGMASSCGPAKSPDGLGVFEAEAIGSRLTPALAIVLERRAGARRLGPHNARVSVGRGGPEVLLQPMVEPRHLAITVHSAPGTERIAQLVRTQLETEACMEHKTGRAWTGHDATRVRQAFLLDPPVGADRSRRYYGGQTDPVPALQGPPDACLDLIGDALPRAEGGARGEGSLHLVPTDVWGASLRPCASDEVRGNPLAEAAAWLPLRSSDDDGPLRRPTRRWSGLDVELALATGDGSDEERARVTMRHDGMPLLQSAPLFQPGVDAMGLVDLLARVPSTYPVTGPSSDPERYTVLLVPDWQLVEALRRLERDEPSAPLHTREPTLHDGVAAVLARPELLHVQVAPPGTEPSWANVASVMRGALPPWGYTVGALGGRSAIVLPGDAPPTWEQTLRAQRGDVHAALLAGLLATLGALLLGLRRLPDLFNPRPEERAHYWPGAEALAIHENETNSPLDGEEAS